LTSSDSISLESKDVYCRGDSPALRVTGVNVIWYADSLKTKLLARGNTYQTRLLDATTTFYLTQTIQGIESDVTPIKIEIVEAFLTSVVTTPASCGNDDGTITVTGKGGTDRYPLSYKLNDGPPQLSGFFDKLAGNTYTLTIQVIGCFGTSEVKVEKEPEPVISFIDQIDPKCGDSNGSIRIAAYGGNGALAYSLDGQKFGTKNLFHHLNGGDFTVWVRDDSSCTVSQSVSLKESTKLQLNQVEITPTSCGRPNGEVTIPFASGNGVLSFSITGRPEQQQSIFDSLQAGSYQVSARDEDGCSDSLSISVAESKGPLISQVHTRKPNCGAQDGQLVVLATGSNDFSYSLDGTTFQDDSSFTDLQEGKFVVRVKDNSGCVAEKNVVLTSTCNRPFFLPSAFTPNKDGINDRWEIFFSESKLEIQEIILYNRWGQVVLHSKPGPITSGYTLWNGSYKGDSVRGTFTYQIRILLSTGASKVYAGAVLAL
jgi:gliding motility-associated-like protein